MHAVSVTADNRLAIAWGIVVAIVGPGIAIGTWFILTWNYRKEKEVITNEAMRRLTAEELEAPAKTQASLDYTRSGSFTTAVSGMSNATPRVSGLVMRRSRYSAFHEELSPEAEKVAREIIGRCLRRWDGLLGIRASSDSLGNRAGIWRSKFDTVRCAVLLLAFRKLNQDLHTNACSLRSDGPGKIDSYNLVM